MYGIYIAVWEQPYIWTTSNMMCVYVLRNTCQNPGERLTANVVFPMALSTIWADEKNYFSIFAFNIVTIWQLNVHSATFILRGALPAKQTPKIN